MKDWHLLGAQLCETLRGSLASLVLDWLRIINGPGLHLDIILALQLLHDEGLRDRDLITTYIPLPEDVLIFFNESLQIPFDQHIGSD